MEGTKCPVCGNNVMSFKDFFGKADLNKKFNCQSCNTELQRPKGKVLFLLIIVLLILMPLAIFIVFQDWGNINKLISIILIGWIYYFAVKFIGWRFISWVQSSSE